MTKTRTKKEPAHEPAHDAADEATYDAALVERIERALAERLDKTGYRHSLGTATMAQSLGTIYGVDAADCFVAGLLHDWDRCRTHKQLIKSAKKHGIKVTKVMRARPRLLHAHTGAAEVALAFPELEPQIIQAVKNHTVGSVPMSDLDKVVYIADMIEPGREFRKIQDFRERIGVDSLDDIFLRCYRQSLRHLIENDKVIHPNTFKVWNWLQLAMRDAAARDA
ncbi:MAG: bis(5'-nucleosyl)-tetraphosphatase (symmetrical) YqeK [Coriobacteriia bacterium]|nr:bis(5'-nucleosyl)-tetraphosphatase (symmetrical) YqeK [Coriobacteriia bacterium]